MADLKQLALAGTALDVPTTLNDLSDVNAPSPVGGQVLGYDASLGVWRNRSISGGAGLRNYTSQEQEIGTWLDGRTWLACPQPNSRMERGRHRTPGLGLTSHCPDCASPPPFTPKGRATHAHVGKHANVHRSREADGGVNTRVALTHTETQAY